MWEASIWCVATLGWNESRWALKRLTGCSWEELWPSAQTSGSFDLSLWNDTGSYCFVKLTGTPSGATSSPSLGTYQLLEATIPTLLHRHHALPSAWHDASCIPHGSESPSPSGWSQVTEAPLGLASCVAVSLAGNWLHQRTQGAVPPFWK